MDNNRVAGKRSQIEMRSSISISAIKIKMH
jgi:hypothetical protein